MASLLATGAVLSMGSDWPVSSYRPLEGLAVAVTRQTRDGVPAEGWLPHERLPVGSALSAYTQGVAYQAFEEDAWGSVTVGRRADLVWLDRDPTTTEPARLARDRGARHLAGRPPDLGRVAPVPEGRQPRDFVVTILYRDGIPCP